ncbi:MAG: hypothetical protein M1815_003835 [Lichina confinis]|nr:MAG: hypothetical protein M1815_003835 [Lichina confinis]
MIGSKKSTVGGHMSVRQAYAGRWADKIECSGCKKWRGQDGYSKRQLAGSKNKIKCRDCTGEQVKELTCIVCTDVKDLGEFSRAQRRVPDHARCIRCVKLYLETEPGLDQREGSDLDDDYSDDDDDSDDGDSEIFPDSASNPFGSDKGQDEPNRVKDLRSLLTIDKLTLSPKLETRSRPTGFGSENIKPGTHSLSGANVARLTDGFTRDNSTFIASTNTAGGVALEVGDDDDASWITPARKKNGNPGPPGTVYTAYDTEGVGHSRVRSTSSVVASDVGLGRGPRKNVPPPPPPPPPKRLGGGAAFVRIKNTPADRPVHGYGGIYDVDFSIDESKKKYKRNKDDDGNDDDDYLAGW